MGFRTETCTDVISSLEGGFSFTFYIFSSNLYNRKNADNAKAMMATLLLVIDDELGSEDGDEDGDGAGALRRSSETVKVGFTTVFQLLLPSALSLTLHITLRVDSCST